MWSEVVLMIISILLVEGTNQNGVFCTLEKFCNFFSVFFLFVSELVRIFVAEN